MGDQFNELGKIEGIFFSIKPKNNLEADNIEKRENKRKKKNW